MEVIHDGEIICDLKKLETNDSLSIIKHEGEFSQMTAQIRRKDLYVKKEGIKQFEEKNPITTHRVKYIEDLESIIENLKNELSAKDKEIEQLSEKGITEKQQDEIEVKLLGRLYTAMTPEATTTDIKAMGFLKTYVEKYDTNNKDLVGVWLKAAKVKPGKRGIRPKPLNPLIC